MTLILLKSSEDLSSYTSKEKCLLVFSAPWCGPCKAMAPHIEQVAARLAGKLSIVKIDIDEFPEIASQYHIMSIPTMVFLEGGKEAQRKIGGLDEQGILNWLSF